jgi:CYTH domain-containing protein
MSKEIERKFLPSDDTWRAHTTGSPARIRQGYLARGRERTVRVRIADDQAFLTVKGPAIHASRDEFEYPIPTGDALAMLDALCEKPLIEKTRHRAVFDGMVFEVDEFHGQNAGLIVIEVELYEENQSVSLPGWVGREVTGDHRYSNSSLIRHPFCSWNEQREAELFRG